MLNASRPRRPSLSTTQPAISDTNTPSSTSFRYSTSRPRFSTNPSRRLSNGFENDDLRNGSASGPSSSTHGSGSTWTEGQYPGPPLPARNPPIVNGTGASSGSNAILKSSLESSAAASGQGNPTERNAGTTPATSSVGSTSRPSRSTNEAVTSHKEQGDAMDVDTSAQVNTGTNVNGRQQEEEAASRTRSSRSNRRPLPPRPHAPPMEQIPAWEPDVKSHIPPNVTLDSRQAAYAQQSNPPAALRSSVTARQDPTRSRAGMLRRPAVNGIVVVSQAGSSRSTNARDKGGKGKGKMLDPTTSGGIAGEYVLDPSLPFSLPDLAVNLSQIGGGADGSQGMKRKRGSIDGEPPSAVFKTEQGDVDLRLSVVNEETMRGDDWRVTEPGSGLNGPARAKSKRAKVEVSSVRGHIRVDLAKIDKSRSISMEISSRAGNLFIQIPENFRGPIHCSTSATQPTILLPTMRSRVKILSTHRGETTCYLGTPSAKPAEEPPLLPPRRFSNRIRERSSGSSLSKLPEGISSPRTSRVFDSPTPMEVDGFRLPSPSQMAHTSSSTFIPTMGGGYGHQHVVPTNAPAATASSSKPPDHGQEEGETPESSLYLSSYTGAITLGLYGREPEHTFKGATTLSGLVQNLGDIKGEMKRKVREKVGL